MMQHNIFYLIVLLTMLLSAPTAQAKGDDKGDLRIQYIYHKVKEGETVYSIAKLYHADIEEIYKLNPGSQKTVWVGATLLIPGLVMADGEADKADTLHIREHLEEFLGQIFQIGSSEVQTLGDIKAAEKRVNAIEAKYNVYYQAKQGDIADNDALMELVSEFQQLKQETLDTLQTQRTQLLQLQDFAMAEKYITSQLAVYKDYEKKATQLSLVEATAQQLDELKTKEQVLFADIDAKYQAAKAAAEQNAALAQRMKKISDNYLLLKNYSEKIQGAEYKSPFDRIKDYLYGLAAVAIVLMFFSMVQAKIKTFKQAREAAKKLEQFKQNNDGAPTI